MSLLNSSPQICGDNSLLIDHLPDDTSSQTYAMKEILSILNNNFKKGDLIQILDLGCGTGGSFDEFRSAGIEFSWVGVDIEDSQEVRSRVRKDLNFMTFNGIDIPLPDESVNLVYSHQVFEHVRNPEELLLEIHRVLKHGGYFIGSTSHLEPFHSRSLWNFTPYGFVTLLKTSNFDSILLRSGIDGLTLMIRRLLGFIKLGNLLDIFFKYESPLNCLTEAFAKLIRMDTKKKNALKLLFSGHFVFIASKK